MTIDRESPAQPPPVVVSPLDLPGSVPARDTAGAWTALLVDSTQELTLTLREALRECGARDVVLAHSVDEVEEVLGHHPGGGELAVVSAHFGADTGPIVLALRHAGWERVLLFNPVGDSAAISEAFDAGATGVLSWPTSYAQVAPPRLTRDLSEREKEVLSLVAAGLSNPQIGTELGLSTSNIRGHLNRISHVIGTGNRCHMVLIALRARVI